MLLVNIFCVGFSLQGQDRERLELPLKAGQARPMLVPAAAYGFMLIEESTQNRSANSEVMKVTLYDTAFQEQWVKEVHHDKKLYLKQFSFEGERLFLLFNSQNREALEVIEISLMGKTFRHEFQYLKRLEIADFKVEGQSLYLGGTLKNLPVLLKMDLKSRKIEPLPMAIDSKTVLIQEIEVIRPGTVTVTAALEHHNRKSILLREMNSNGSGLKDLIMKPQPGYGLLSADFSTVGDEERIAIGTYTYKNEESAQGFYFSKYQGDEPLFRNYYSFADLSNFFSFMEEKNRVKIEQKAKRKKEKGKKFRVKYRLLVHDIIKKNGQYIMLGEAYFPVYRTERIDDFYSRRGYSQTRIVFDGYQYTHAVVAVFDEQGQLLWDNSFKIDRTKTKVLTKRVKMHVDDGELKLVYNLEGKLNKLVVTADRVIKEDDEPLNNEFDSVKNADLGESGYWYANKFIAWGYQRIKNQKQQGLKKRRNVFYINKLEFD